MTGVRCSTASQALTGYTVNDFAGRARRMHALSDICTAN